MPVWMLYAKVKVDSGNYDIEESATLFGHLRDVSAVAEAAGYILSKRICRSCGLDPGVWQERFEKALVTSARLHDLGKANDQFQMAIKKAITNELYPQAIRHEAMSVYLLVKLHAEEFARAHPDKNLRLSILLAILYHHRKFFRPEGGKRAGESWSEDSWPLDKKDEPAKVRLYLDDTENGRIYKSIVDWALGGDYQLRPSPGYVDPLKVLGTLNPLANDPLFADLWDFANNLRDNPEYRDWSVFTRSLQGALINCDVLGSVLPSAKKEMSRERMSDSLQRWVAQAFGGVMEESDCENVIRGRIGQQGALRGFQKAVGRTPRISLLRAGCGSGKTLAAYEWAKQHNRKLFFTYPTTGLATEGFLDYMDIDGVEATVMHSRKIADFALNGPAEDKDEDVFRQDRLRSIEDLTSQVVSCTVDTVLLGFRLSGKFSYGLMGLLHGAFVFDEAHAYDDKMWKEVLNILKTFRGIPAIFMTASLPPHRMQELKLAFEGEFEEYDGPEEQRTNQKYTLKRSDAMPIEDRRGQDDQHFFPDEVIKDIADRARAGEKVLVVCNVVARAQSAFRFIQDQLGEDDLDVFLYHSRYRYKDRKNVHRRAVDGFKEHSAKGCVLVATQVAEMSLDLNADYLVSEIAPVPSLIQRMGRLNRPLDAPAPKTCLVVELPEKPERGVRDISSSPLPYGWSDINEALVWLNELVNSGPFSQEQAFEVYKANVDPNKASRDYWMGVYDFVMFRAGTVREEQYATRRILLGQDYYGEDLFAGVQNRTRFIESVLIVPDSKAVTQALNAKDRYRRLERYDVFVVDESLDDVIYDCVYGLHKERM